MNYSDLEPVRLIGRITAALVAASAVAKQVADTYDEGTGWLGLALAAVVVIATELQRAKVTPVAKLESNTGTGTGGSSTGTTYGG